MMAQVGTFKKSKRAQTAALERVFKARRANLRALHAAGGMFTSQRALARALGITAQELNQMIGESPKRSVSESKARTFEQSLGLMPGWLDMTR